MTDLNNPGPRGHETMIPVEPQPLGYDKSDQGMDQKDLEDKYCDAGHPVYTLAKYKEELSKNPVIEESFNGYYDWVSFKCAADEISAAGVDMEEIVDITSVEQFAALVQRWHGSMIERLKNLREIPFGTDVEYVDHKGNAGTVSLKGDAMKGHQAALTAAIAELENWPFVVSTEEAEDGTQAGN